MKGWGFTKSPQKGYGRVKMVSLFRCLFARGCRKRGNRPTDFCGTVPRNVGLLASMISLTDRHKGPSTVTLAAQGLIIRLHLWEKVPLIAVDHVVNFLDCLHNRCFWLVLQPASFDSNVSAILYR